MDRMSLDDSLRRNLKAIIESKFAGNTNACAKASGVREGAIRAIFDGTTQSTRLATVEKLSGGLDVTPGVLLGTESVPVNFGLLQTILETLLQNLGHRDLPAERIARSVLRVYEAGIATGVNPNDPLDVAKITHSEGRQLLDAVHQLKAAK